MTKEDYEVLLQLVNVASFTGDKAEYVASLKAKLVKKIECIEKGSE